jgi:hypothetical protein
MTIRKPSYRYHKARNRAVVTIGGKDHYLGEYDSPESWEQYHRLVAEWLAVRIAPPVLPQTGSPPLSVSELLLRYWRFVESYYVKDGRPTSEQDTIRQALRFVRELYGSTMAMDFGPLKLKAIHEAMIGHGWSRRYINKQVSCVKRLFSWAVEFQDSRGVRQ